MKTYRITGSLGTWRGTVGSHSERKYEDVDIVVTCDPNKIDQLVRLMHNWDGGIEYEEVRASQAA